MKRSLYKAAFLPLASLTVALTYGPAMAQDASTAEADNQLSDIVVVARKIGESAQSLPITVAAFSGAELTTKAVLTVQDLQAITPGLTISNNSTGGVPIFAIRGTSTELGIDGGVALYFNDVPLISTVGIMNAFYDVSTVEVLKGPQGTQFGTNTTGGTITVRTNLPTDRFEGYVKAGYGNYNRREVEGVVNLPVNDVLGFRFAGNYVKRDGYAKNPLATGSIPTSFSNEDHYSLRGTMSLNSGPIESVLILDYYNRDEAPIALIPTAFGPSALGINPGDLGLQTGSRKRIFIGPNPSGIDPSYFGKAKLFGLQHRVQMELSDTLSLRNVIGYRHDNTATSEEDSGTSLSLINILNNTRTDQWNDDITLQYKGFDGRLRLNVGGYFSMTDKRQGINAIVAQGTYIAVAGLPLVTAIRNDEHRKFNSKAVYTNADFDITDTLGVSGGFRYNWDRVSSLVSATQANAVLPDYGYNFRPDAANPCSTAALAAYEDKNLAQCVARRSRSFRAPSYNFVVTNKFSPRVLGYAKISHGYLAGGTNFTIREVPFYAPEKTTMLEAGLKADWQLADRPIRTNIALYRGRTSNKQVNYNANYDDGFSAYGVFNAARVAVYGADLEVRYSPVQGLTLDGSYNYIKAKFKDFIFPAVGGNGDGLTGVTLVPSVDLSGATPAQTPKHQFNLAASYVWPLDDKVGTVTSTISGYYTSKITQTNVFSPYEASFGKEFNELDSYFIASASLNWDNALGSPVSAQLWVRNLFDRNYITFRNSQFQAFGLATAAFGAPRTFGGSATLKF